ncbi:MAG TPA: M64 family metallopeptidase [Polyangiaceae bacterium]|nr:M64 family metallopeptidase [Polyangiaceae bacterium]
MSKHRLVFLLSGALWALAACGTADESPGSNRTGSVGGSGGTISGGTAGASAGGSGGASAAGSGGAATGGSGGTSAGGSGGASAGGSGGVSAGGAAGSVTTGGGAGAGGASGAGTGGAAGSPGTDGGSDAPRTDATVDSRPPDVGAPDVPPFDAGPSRWIPHFIGTGQIEDIVTGTPIDLPMDRRLHVAMLPEGYLQSDLDAAFDLDIDAWMTEVFAIEPYSIYKQAFVVWKIRLPSAARVAAADPQTADTAFSLGMTTDGTGVGNFGTMSAARVWDALRDFPVAISSYGTGNRGARNAVAYMHVLEPQRGRAGFSGRTTSVTDPANSAQRISVAIALGRAHEFTHAFSRLSDEYIELDSTNPPANTGTNTSAGITNVVASPTCSTVPWRHLFMGTPINPSTDQLVGAFGTAAQGYHSELKCLLNGSHDNATVFGGNGNMRSNDRMCNFCREVTTFRIFERSSVLTDPATSLDAWTNTYRTPFYTKFGFKVPTPLPQTSSDGKAWWMPCTP